MGGEGVGAGVGVISSSEKDPIEASDEKKRLVMEQGPHQCRQGGQKAVGAKSPETSKEGALEQWRLLGGQQGQQKQEDWGQG